MKSDTDMNMKQLKYVLVLVNEGSFARAADALGISQPSLSQYVKKIEKQVGMELFDRTGGDVRLTDAGRVYVDAGKKILELEYQMQSRFSDLAAHKIGSVVVGTSPYRSSSMMPAAVKTFQENYPGMHVIVEEMTTAELFEATEHGKFDLCLTIMPVDERLFTWEKITDEELILAVPSSYPKLKSEVMNGRKYPAVDAEQLGGGNFVMITESQVMQKTLENICVDYDLSIQKAAVVKSLEAQIAMVRAGVGMALVPSGIERFCTDNEVTFYSFKEDLPKREVVAMWLKDRTLNQATRNLLDIIKGIAW